MLGRRPIADRRGVVDDLGAILRSSLVTALGVLACLALVGPAGAAPTVTTCTDSLSDVTVEDLVVPAGATCRITDVTVTNDVLVEPNATLEARDTSFEIGGDVTVETAGVFSVSTSENLGTTFTAGGGIRVETGATLEIGGTNLHIGGSVVARGARLVGLARIPFIGSTGSVGGDVIVREATGAVAIEGLEIGGRVSIRGSGISLAVGDNEIAESLSVEHNTIVGLERFSILSLMFNTVGGTLRVVGNDAMAASEPPRVGGNVVSNGNLACHSNVPDLTNTDPDGTVHVNTVLSGHKLGQCAAL
jgi:hypothetical protein